jgi:adenylosuccinate lyase
MSVNSLMAVSPVDGRYSKQVKELSDYFSEFALIKYRIRTEIEYFIALCDLPLPQLAGFPKDKYQVLKDIYIKLDEEDALKIKEIEKITNHDVKAVEYFIKERFAEESLEEFSEFIHFGLTSQDINNTAGPAALKDFTDAIYFPALNELTAKLDFMAEEWKSVPMLAHTHGQPASPTRLGKEIEVFSVRIKEQLRLLRQIPFAAKFGGATGNLNAHLVAYPEIDWNGFAKDLVEKRLGLYRSQPTTQIEHYDHIAAYFDNLKRINTILIDLARDFWTYISMEYFRQKIKEGEIGSSAMPHKVNPIDFENAEGNLGVANALFEHLAAKLPVSRMQRDLTDSTVLRNTGVPLAHTIISFKSLQKGLGKIILNRNAVESDLDSNWAVVAEAIQTILRRENYPKPYEALKALTRTNEQVTEKTIKEFIDTLNVSEKIKEELRNITPRNYTGV